MLHFFETLKTYHFSYPLMIVTALCGITSGIAVRYWLHNERAYRTQPNGREHFNTPAHLYRTRLLEASLRHMATTLIVIGLICAFGAGAKYFSVFG
jgi:hypothetical protein